MFHTMMTTIIVTVCLLFATASMQLASTNAALEFNEWIQHLNDDLRLIYQQAASFAWESGVNPTEAAAHKLRIFNANKSKWNNARCSEINDFFINVQQHPFATSISNITILNASAHLLCNGPKFNEQQAKALTTYLQRMQTIFVDTQICLPKRFDICRNLDHIWDFTYVSRPGNHLNHLDLSAVKPIINEKTKLQLFDGYISSTYYLNLEHEAVENQKSTEYSLRSGEMIYLGGEEELDRIMRGDFDAFNRSDCALRYNEVFRWAWESWRAAVGNEIGLLYRNAIDLMNIGAKENGYSDIGSVWKEEVDLFDLDETIEYLMQQTRPFYKLLHGMTRNVLWKQMHKSEPFDRRSTIPAHLLGSMWSQNWELHQQLILPFNEFNLDETMKKLNWTSKEMVNRADDFYRSLNLPAMTKQFWQNSIFQKTEHFRNCHGTAANLFQPNDYRMIVCAESTLHDLSVIVHEMGHLQYFMAFADQLPIFQDGNAAIQESIGDAIFLAMITPHHLNRLNILPDKYLISNKPTDSIIDTLFSLESNVPEKMKSMNVVNGKHSTTVNEKLFQRFSASNNSESKNAHNPKLHNAINVFDLSLLLRMALIKIPQIPFQYIMDVFRWNLFNGTVSMSDANAFYWNLAMLEQGIHPPDWKDRRDYFDLGAKYHTADNTPFMRYFLASFIQAQIFEGLCKVTIFDTVHTKQPLPMPLHRCDIYGSKRAGKLLKRALQLGSSKHWTHILHMLTGSRQVTADALLLYYKPLIVWLREMANEFNISTGWSFH